MSLDQYGPRWGQSLFYAYLCNVVSNIVVGLFGAVEVVPIAIVIGGGVLIPIACWAVVEVFTTHRVLPHISYWVGAMLVVGILCMITRSGIEGSDSAVAAEAGRLATIVFIVGCLVSYVWLVMFHINKYSVR